jgi:hypothetical protein
MSTINKNGCSVCATGSENYCTFSTRLRGKNVKMYQYDFRAENGNLFSTVALTLAECRKKRDEWLNKN